MPKVPRARGTLVRASRMVDLPAPSAPMAMMPGAATLRGSTFFISSIRVVCSVSRRSRLPMLVLRSSESRLPRELRRR